MNTRMNPIDMKMGATLSNNQRQEYLDEHIPYRLRSVDALSTLCLLATQTDIEHQYLSAWIHTNNKAITIDTIVGEATQDVNNALIENGLMNMRLLYSLLCISSDAKNNPVALKAPRIFSKDITLYSVMNNSTEAKCLRDDNLPTFFEKVCDKIGLKNISTHRLAEIILFCSQSSAHLTSIQKQPALTLENYCASVLIQGAILNRVYDIEKRDIKRLKSLTHFDSWSQSLLAKKTKEKHDEIIDFARQESQRLWDLEPTIVWKQNNSK